MWWVICHLSNHPSIQMNLFWGSTSNGKMSSWLGIPAKHKALINLDWTLETSGSPTLKSTTLSQGKGSGKRSRLVWSCFRSEYAQLWRQCSSDALWMPMYPHSDFPCQVVLESSGSIFWIPPYILTTTCKLDHTWFPFDEQTCDIKFGSWAHNGWSIDIQVKEESLDTSGFVRNEEWELSRTTGKRNEVLYECCPEPYLDITYTLHLTRRPSSHIQKILVPSALLTLLGILSLLLPASQPSSRLLILLFSFLMISLGFSDVPQPSLMATMLGSCIFTLLLLIVHTILVASLANSRSFYLACSPIWPRRWLAKENQEEAFKAQAQRIAWWIDFAASWIYLVCFGAYLSNTVMSRFPVVK